MAGKWRLECLYMKLKNENVGLCNVAKEKCALIITLPNNFS